MNDKAAIEAIVKQPAPANPNNLTNFKNILNNIHIQEYDPKLFWDPKLFVYNAIGDLKVSFFELLFFFPKFLFFNNISRKKKNIN